MIPPLRHLSLGFAVACVLSGVAWAGEADDEAVRIAKERGGSYRFDVTVRHADTGWKHYADRWDVVAAGGRVLGHRVLVHPHENEQPFTRSLFGVSIPAGIVRVTVRAHDTVHGLGGKEAVVKMPK